MTDAVHELHRETEPIADEGGDDCLSLSERAVATVATPQYWRRVNAIEGDGGPDYELAFFEAQCEIDAIIEADAENSHLKNKYATLAGLLSKVRPVLARHRITIKQFPGRVHRLGSDANKQMFLPICTTLTHVDSGQGETFVWEMPVNKVDPQALGSLSTYGRRYAIAGIFGIASVDDDAAAASIRNKIERDQGADVVDTLIMQMQETKTLADLKKWLSMHRDGFEVFSDENMEKLRVAYDKRRGELESDCTGHNKPDKKNGKAPTKAEIGAVTP